MPITTHVPHLAGLIAAARIICRIYEKYGERLVTQLDTPEAAALVALGAACAEFKATFPLND